MNIDAAAFEFLKCKVCSYITLNDQEIQSSLNYFQIRSFAKNQYLLREGQVCDFWGFIQQGLVRSYSLTTDGDEYTLGCIREGSFISFFSMYVICVLTNPGDQDRIDIAQRHAACSFLSGSRRACGTTISVTSTR